MDKTPPRDKSLSWIKRSNITGLVYHDVRRDVVQLRENQIAKYEFLHELVLVQCVFPSWCNQCNISTKKNRNETKKNGVDDDEVNTTSNKGQFIIWMYILLLTLYAIVFIIKCENG